MNDYEMETKINALVLRRTAESIAKSLILSETEVARLQNDLLSMSDSRNHVEDLYIKSQADVARLTKQRDWLLAHDNDNIINEADLMAAIDADAKKHKDTKAKRLPEHDDNLPINDGD